MRKYKHFKGEEKMRILKAVRNNATVTIPKLDLVYDDRLSARKINVVKKSLEQLASELQALQTPLIETLTNEVGYESFLSREWPNFVHASKKLFALITVLKIEHHCFDEGVAHLIPELLALDEEALPTRDLQGLQQFLQHIIALSTACQSSILETSLDQLQRELESNTVMNLSGLSLVLDLDTLNDAHISSVRQGLLGLTQQAEDLTKKVSESNVLIETPKLLSAECDELMQASIRLLDLMSTLGFETEFNAETPLADRQYQNEHCVALQALILSHTALDQSDAQYYNYLQTTMTNTALRIPLLNLVILDRLGALQEFCIKNNTILGVTQDALTPLHQSINAHRRSSKNPSVCLHFVDDRRTSSAHAAGIEQAHTEHHQQRLEEIQGFQRQLKESSSTLMAYLRPETVLGAQTVSDSEAGGASELGTSLSLQLNAVERLVHIEQRRTDILLELSQFNMQVLGDSEQQSGETPTFQFDLDSYLQLLNQARADSTQFGLSSLDEDQFYSQYLKPLFDLQHAQLAVFDPDAQDQALADKAPEEVLESLKQLEKAWGDLECKCKTLLDSENKKHQSDHRLFDLSYQHMAQIYLYPVKIQAEMVGVLQDLNQCLLKSSHAVAEGLSDSEFMRVYDDWLKGFLIKRVQGQTILNQRPPSVDEVSALDRRQATGAHETLKALEERMNDSDGVDTSATQKLEAYAELYPGNERCIALLTQARDQLIEDFLPSIEQHNAAIETARDTVSRILSTRCPDGLALSNMYRRPEKDFENDCLNLAVHDQKRLIEQILQSEIEDHLSSESEEAEVFDAQSLHYIHLVTDDVLSEHADVIQADIQNQVQQAEEKVDQFLKANEDSIFKCFATQNRIVGLIGTEAASQDEAAECAVPYDPLTLLNSLSRLRDIDLSDSNQPIEAHAASEEEPAAEPAAELEAALEEEPAADAILEDTLYSRLALKPALIQLRIQYNERRQYVSGQFLNYLNDNLASRSAKGDFSENIYNCAKVLKAETNEADEQSPLLPQPDFDSKLFRNADDYRACVENVELFYTQFESLQAMKDAHTERRDDNRRSMTNRSMGFGLLGSLGLAAWRLELAHLVLNGVSVAGVSIAPIFLGFSIVCLALIPLALLIRYCKNPYRGFKFDAIAQQEMRSCLRDSSSALSNQFDRATSFVSSFCSVAPRSAASFAEVSPASEAPVRFDDTEVRPDNGVRSAAIVHPDGYLVGGF
jgi:hypothetical protein